MTVSITIRSVPDRVRDELAARAARSGRSLQEFLVAELTALAAKPSLDAALELVRERAAAYPALSNTDVLAALDADRQ